MSPSSPAPWTFSFPLGVEFTANQGGRLHSLTDQWPDPLTATELKILKQLALGPAFEEDLLSAIPDPKNKTTGIALLYRLERHGFLSRGMQVDGKSLFSVQPHRPPDRSLRADPPGAIRKLTPHVIIRPEESGFRVEATGNWAGLLIEDSQVLEWLYELGTGVPRKPTGEDHILDAFISMLSWIGCLLEEETPQRLWSFHDCRMHTATRLGFRRRHLGKRKDSTARFPKPPQLDPSDSDSLVYLDRPAPLSRCSLQQALQERRSTRNFGEKPIPLNTLGQLLFHTFGEVDARHHYPSGGSCYAISAYVAVSKCSGLAPGLYRYLDNSHDLCRFACTQRAMTPLLRDASRATGIDSEPQVLVVLAARFEEVQSIYSELSYSLILKEVGAVLQTLALVAASLGVAACPLGSGNSLHFSKLIGASPWKESSVGEMLVGSMSTLPTVHP